MEFPSQISSRVYVVIYEAWEIFSADDSLIEVKIDLSSTKLPLFSNKSASSKCAKFRISLVCSWHDVAYGVHKTTGCVKSASEYGHDVYVSAL